MFAEVILELPLKKSFDYEIPQNMVQRIKPGMRAWVPFGGRRLPAYIVAVKETCEYENTKQLIRLIDKNPLLLPSLIKLADWIKDYYFCNLGNVFKSMLPQRIRQLETKKDEQKYVKIINPKIDIESLEKKAPKQAHIINILARQKKAIKLMDLARMSKTTSSTINTLHKKGLVQIFNGRIDRDPYRKEIFQYTFPLRLNEEQKKAYDLITSTEKGVVLLQGVTGSGKTEVYLQAIDNSLKNKKGAIVIVPEISLTPQTVERFKERFRNNEVAVLHSRLSAGERSDQWEKIYEGKANIVIGARSAIFAPVCNLGLIVVDEEHERSYKQEDEPRYNARDVAIKRGEIEGAVVVLGSATPSIESYYNAQMGKYKLAKLTKRIDNRPLADVRIINLKEEIKKFRKLLTFTYPLITQIRDRIEKKEQIILFLNRRGFSSFILCRKCGFMIRCPNCITALTYHQLGDKLICHTCGHEESTPKFCPECKDNKIRFSGLGTQRVESLIARFFPQARIKRMDTDVTTVKGSHKKILDEFKRGDIDILVGTQMIAKGLDFPNVTLVGVISADIALHLTDFRAGEHTFQLLTQVAGRAGRGKVLGNVIIQTMTPDHPAIKSASTQDYDEFAKSELAIRKELDYPPFEHFVNVTFRSKNPQKAELVAREYQKLLEPIISSSNKVKLFGPIPAPISKLRGQYRWQILFRSKEVEDIIPLLKKISKYKGVIITVDIDPISML